MKGLEATEVCLGVVDRRIAKFRFTKILAASRKNTVPSFRAFLHNPWMPEIFLAGRVHFLETVLMDRPKYSIVCVGFFIDFSSHLIFLLRFDEYATRQHCFSKARRFPPPPTKRWSSFFFKRFIIVCSLLILCVFSVWSFFILSCNRPTSVDV